ncbi:MAG: hypothetical protein E7342_01695 [Clostridiales bacterium]|nr:hypothetical protein [Clostridiales bacterium]
MANLLKFENTPERYLKIAKEKQERGEYANALSTLYFALKKGENGCEKAKIYSQIAEVYKNINNAYRAIDYSFKALNELKTEEEKKDLYSSLGHYFLAINKLDLSHVYFEKATKAGAFEEFGEQKVAILEKLKELLETPEFKLVKSEANRDFEIMKEAESFLRKNNIQPAIEEYLKITPDSEYYEQAIINLSFCYEELNQKEVAIKILETANKLIYSIGIIARLISIYQETDKQKAESCYKKLLKKDTDDFEELNLIMLVASTMEDDKTVLSIAEKILTLQLPNDFYFLIGFYGFLAVSNYNLKNYKKAKEYFKMQNDLIDGDDACKYYIDEIDKILSGKKSADKIKRIDYGKQLPKKELENRINSVVGLFLDEKDKKLTPTKEKLIKEKDNIYWATFYGNKNLFNVVSEGVFRTDKEFSLELYKEVFLNRYMDGECKKKILKLLVKGNLVKEIAIIAENVYKKITLTKKELDGVFLEAYLNLICMSKKESFEDFFELLEMAEKNYKLIEKYPKSVIECVLTAFVDEENFKTWLKNLKTKKKLVTEVYNLIIKGENYENS